MATSIPNNLGGVSAATLEPQSDAAAGLRQQAKSLIEGQQGGDDSLARAEALLKQALEVKPNDGQTRVMLAQVYYQLERWADSVATLEPLGVLSADELELLKMAQQRAATQIQKLAGPVNGFSEADLKRPPIERWQPWVLDSKEP